MIALTRRPSSLPDAIAARSMSPVDELDEAVGLLEALCLRALAGARRPEQDHVHPISGAPAAAPS